MAQEFHSKDIEIRHQSAFEVAKTVKINMSVGSAVRILCVLPLLSVCLMACSGIKIPAFNKLSQQQETKSQFKKEKTPTPSIIRVSGYSAYSVGEKGPDLPERLQALRASKLDAYRALAERIYGVAVAGTSSVNDHKLQRDGVKTMVDTVVRGARVVSISETKDGLVETIMELELEGNFKLCLNAVNQIGHDAECRIPLSTMGVTDMGGDVQTNSSNTHYYIN